MIYEITIKTKSTSELAPHSYNKQPDQSFKQQAIAFSNRLGFLPKFTIACFTLSFISILTHTFFDLGCFLGVLSVLILAKSPKGN